MFYEAVLAKLLEANVRFLVVGAVAMNRQDAADVAALERLKRLLGGAG